MQRTYTVRTLTEADEVALTGNGSNSDKNKDENKNKNKNNNEIIIIEYKDDEQTEDDTLEIDGMMDEIDNYFIKQQCKGIDNSAIESTMRFKYIRSLEALFESTPQSVLQLVYLMRTSDFDDIVIGISIFQSILSMTNSMLASDNAYMAREKFQQHKERFPPSIQFLKHFLVRLSEISYRVGLFAIFWTVVGGEWFSVLLGYELMFTLFPLIVTIRDIDDYSDIDWEWIFLSINMVCIYRLYLFVQPKQYICINRLQMLFCICFLINYACNYYNYS